ncbi:MAG: SAM-dependent methyltransferase [Burkholderiaceae bacterium]|nr:SAM-dependent methyltransferase [Burkholderiaceae bacterium]
MKATSGKLHLIPVGLGDADPAIWLPTAARELASQLSIYIAENAKTARAFLKLIGTAKPLQEITIYTLDNKVDNTQIRKWLQPLLAGQDIGLVSEAGCPAVADPGAKVVSVAHAMNLRVVPWVGPSSILLSLMASGLEGQRFAFHGYAPVNPAERALQLKAWESDSHKHQQTQILIETPYRNDAMLATLLSALKGNTRLCVARSLTTEQEWVQTCSVSEWKSRPTPSLAKQPAIFLFLA